MKSILESQQLFVKVIFFNYVMLHVTQKQVINYSEFVYMSDECGHGTVGPREEKCL